MKCKCTFLQSSGRLSSPPEEQAVQRSAKQCKTVQNSAKQWPPLLSEEQAAQRLLPPPLTWHPSLSFTPLRLRIQQFLECSKHASMWLWKWIHMSLKMDGSPVFRVGNNCSVVANHWIRLHWIHWFLGRKEKADPCYSYLLPVSAETNVSQSGGNMVNLYLYLFCSSRWWDGLWEQLNTS